MQKKSRVTSWANVTRLNSREWPIIIFIHIPLYVVYTAFSVDAESHLLWAGRFQKNSHDGACRFLFFLLLIFFQYTFYTSVLNSFGDILSSSNHTYCLLQHVFLIRETTFILIISTQFIHSYYQFLWITLPNDNVLVLQFYYFLFNQWHQNYPTVEKYFQLPSIIKRFGVKQLKADTHPATR